MAERPEYALYNRRQTELAQRETQRGGPANLADILERVLDKGIVIAGDIQINLLDIELLTIKLRLLIASVERAQEMGINWWESDPSLSNNAKELEQENRDLRERLDRLERLVALPAPKKGEEVVVEETHTEEVVQDRDGEREETIVETTHEEVIEADEPGGRGRGSSRGSASSRGTGSSRGSGSARGKGSSPSKGSSGSSSGKGSSRSKGSGGSRGGGRRRTSGG
jgi:hypothetical protein